MHKLFFCLAVFITLAITAGSLLSLDVSELQNTKISDKLIHIVGYFLMALSWELAYNLEERNKRISISIAIIVLFYGILIEVLQQNIGGNRQFELLDIISNFIGISIAFTFFSRVFGKKSVN